MLKKWWPRLKLLFNFKKSIPLVFRLLKDKRVPITNKLFFLAVTIGYFILPIDIIPDFLFPGIGYLDDLAVVLIFMEKFIDSAPPHVLNEYLPS